MSTADLERASGPWLLSIDCPAAKAYELAWRLDSGGGAARVLRGTKMRTVAGLFNEVGAALQFPDYFGENWPALDECLTDLSWMPAKRYVLIIVGADEVLVDENKEVLGLLHDLLTKAGVAWAEPVARGESWDRPAIPFHVILQGRADSLERWGQSLVAFAE